MRSVDRGWFIFSTVLPGNWHYPVYIEPGSQLVEIILPATGPC
jgi:hypothetical protein